MFHTNAKLKLSNHLVAEKVTLKNTFPWRTGEIPEIKDTQGFLLHYPKPLQGQGSFAGSSLVSPTLLSAAWARHSSACQDFNAVASGLVPSQDDWFLSQAPFSFPQAAGLCSHWDSQRASSVLLSPAWAQECYCCVWRVVFSYLRCK